MITKYISCKKILADFYRDVKPQTSDWMYNAIEWINFALGELGGGFNLELVSEEITVENHRAKLPCNNAALKQVIYNGSVIHKYNTINIDEYDLSNIAFWNELSPGYIRLSFTTGVITLYYYTVSTEFDKLMGIKLPLVPDDGTMQVRNYLQEYILMKWLAQGNTHPVRTYAEVKLGVYTGFGSGAGLLHRAKNAIKFPATYDMELLKDSLVHLKSDWQKAKYEWFNSTGETTGDTETPTDYYITNENQ